MGPFVGDATFFKVLSWFFMEAERAAMIDRRRHFMATLMDQPLTEETLAAARAANIFIG